MHRRLTTYEAISALRDAYHEKKTPDLRLYRHNPTLWWLADTWSRYVAESEHTRLPTVQFRFASAQQYLETLSTWRHIVVDGAALEQGISAHVHGGSALTLEALDALRQPALALVNSMRALPALQLLESEPLACLSDEALNLALEAPDVRKAALQIWYRRVRRAHETVSPGDVCDAIVQRARPAHIVEKHRWRLLHAPCNELTDSDWCNLRLACVHCTMQGQQQFSGRQGVVYKVMDAGKPAAAKKYHLETDKKAFKSELDALGRVGGGRSDRLAAHFDATLRQRNPEFGYRDVAQVATAAATVGLAFASTTRMPANNLLLEFVRS